MEKSDHTKICPDCGGVGRVQAPFSLGPMGILGIATGNIALGLMDTKTCPTCQGIGTVHCRADGTIIHR